MDSSKLSSHIVLYLISSLVLSCSMKEINLIYIDSKIQQNYPSGSTITYLNNHFYIMGDDASEMFVLNEDLKSKPSIPVFEKGENLRTPKATKADIESSYTAQIDGKELIVLLGSGSLTPHRDTAYVVNPEDSKVVRIDYSTFYNQLRKTFPLLNIEAATIIGDELALGIRANTSFPDNYIALASSNLQLPVFKRKILLELPVENTGISGMDYDEKNDILFVTFSSEATANNYEDGQVGESYLAIVLAAQGQLKSDVLKIKCLYKLSDLSIDFSYQKIESVSLVKGKRELLLVADDDLGETKLFRMKF